MKKKVFFDDFWPDCVALSAISQQVKYVILQSIIWKFNKDPDYPSPDQRGGQKTFEKDGGHFRVSFRKFWMPCIS